MPILVTASSSYISRLMLRNFISVLIITLTQFYCAFLETSSIFEDRPISEYSLLNISLYFTIDSILLRNKK